MTTLADNGLGRQPGEWNRPLLDAFIRYRLDDMDSIPEAYGVLKLEIIYQKGKIVQVADERRLTHK